MNQNAQSRLKVIIDLEILNSTNTEGCASCGKKFTLGETAVYACGGWEGGLKLVHENEAVFDNTTSQYIEQSCYNLNLS